MNQETNSQIQLQQNIRMYERNIPSGPLQPYLNVRPVSTKYSIMPIVDPRKKINVPFNVIPTFNMGSTFDPGNAPGPWSGYASQINTESELKNQIYALQNCDQSVYVPNSTSDLYNYRFKPSSNVQQPFPDLFTQSRFEQCSKAPPNMHSNVFYSSTRVDTMNTFDEQSQQQPEKPK